MKRGPSLLAGVIVVMSLAFFMGSNSKAANFQHQASKPLCSYEELVKAIASSGIQDWKIVAVPAVQTTKGTCLVIVAEK
jgi:hypothetical protein